MKELATRRLGLVLFLLPNIIIGFLITRPVMAAPNHVVISEIQIGGTTAGDEFVELFNPTGSAVNLQGWRLSKRTASGNQTNLLTIFPDINLAPGGYFLITHPTGYTGAITADAKYSTSESLAANNTVVLFSDAGNTIVDLIGLGTASSYEGAAASNPPSGQSIERIKDANGIIDTDNNAADFATATVPTPMNLSSQPPAESPPPAEEPPPPTEPEDTNTTPPPTDSEATPPPGGGGGGGTLPTLPGDIIINEFVADPTDEDEEWIELVNRTGRTIDLTNWIIEDGGEHQTVLSGSVNGIAPNNFFIVSKPKGNLNNAGDRIILKIQNGQIIDQVSYGNWPDGNTEDNAPAGRDPLSVARTIDGFSSGNAAFDFTTTLTPTRGQPNIITTTGSSAPTGPATLRLSELLPNPQGSDMEEFIEVTNIGSADVNIAGWRIADASDADYTIKEKDFTNPIILPGAYLALPRALTGLALNNIGGESVKLFPPNSVQPVHEISYTGSALEGASWADFSNQWSWTTTATPGTANALTKANRPPVISLDLPKNGFTGDKLLFSAEDSTDPDGDSLSFQWLFGDDETAPLGGDETVSHAYIKPGRYRVRLIINDGHDGQDSAERTIIIEAAAEPQPQVLGISALADTAGIILTEIFPAPKKGEEEWIELYNQGDDTIRLANWSLKDASGRTYTLPLDTIILPRNYLVLKKSQTRLALNNTGDDVIFYNPNDEAADETSYPTAKTGASWARDENDEWNWTSNPTPLANNIFREPENNDTGKAANSSSTKQAPRGVITVSGLVTAAPGMVGERVFYLGHIQMENIPQDLRIDLPANDAAPKIALGDQIKVTGKIRQVQGELRMSLEDNNDLKILSKNNPVTEPAPLETTDVNNLGRLVAASGTVNSKTSAGFVMELANGETIRVVVPPAVKSKVSYLAGTEVSVVGILSRTSAGLRILLRTEQDLTINAPPLATETIPDYSPAPASSSYVMITILGSLILAGAVAYLYWKKRAAALVTVEGLDEEETV